MTDSFNSPAIGSTEYVESIPNGAVIIDGISTGEGEAKIFIKDENGEWKHVPSLDAVAQELSKAKRERGLVTLDEPVEFIHKGIVK